MTINWKRFYIILALCVLAIFCMVAAFTAETYKFESGGPGRKELPDGSYTPQYMDSWGFRERGIYWCSESTCLYIGREVFSDIHSGGFDEGYEYDIFRRKWYTYIFAIVKVGYLERSEYLNMPVELSEFIGGGRAAEVDLNFSIRTHYEEDWPGGSK